MRSYRDLMNEIIVHIKANDVDAVIATVRSALEPYAQKNELKRAIIFLRSEIYGDNIFHYSFRERSKELRDILVENALIPEIFYTRKNRNNQTPLSLAVRYGDLDYVEQALKKGAEPNELAESDKSLITIAAGCLDLEMVKLLIEYKADIELYGWSSIFSALTNTIKFSMSEMENQTEIVKLMIKNGANVLRSIGDDREYLLLNKANYLNNNPDVIALLAKETSDRKGLNYTIPVMLWASENKEDSTIYRMPKEMIKTIAEVARNRKI